MAIQQLDLEEQEQLANLRHLWQRYGRYVSIALLALVVALVSWQAWTWWHSRQIEQVVALYETFDKELELQRQAADKAQVDGLKQQLTYLQSHFSGMAQTSLATFLTAQWFSQRPHESDMAFALTQWQWLRDYAYDSTFASLARLNVASLLLKQKNYIAAREALATLPADEFAALFADKRGDIFLLEGRLDEARMEYEAALQAIEKYANAAGKPGHILAKVQDFSALQEGLKNKQQMLRSLSATQGAAPATKS